MEEKIMDRLKGNRALITGRNPATLDSARKELGSTVLIIPSEASDVGKLVQSQVPVGRFGKPSENAQWMSNI
jgi:hypothetical protein